MDNKSFKFANEDVEKKTYFSRITTILGFKGILTLVILFIVTVFCLQNIENTSIQFFFWKIVEVSKISLVLSSILLGIVLGLLFSFIFRREEKM